MKCEEKFNQVLRRVEKKAEKIMKIFKGILTSLVMMGNNRLIDYTKITK